MKIVTLPKGFPVSEIFSLLDIYTLRSRELDNEIIIEMSEFDYYILSNYINREGEKYGVTKL